MCLGLANGSRKTIVKTAKTIKKGDVFRTEYGDFDNWVNFEFISCEPHKDRCTKITVKSTCTGRVFDVYENTPIDRITFDVVEEMAGDDYENTN